MKYSFFLLIITIYCLINISKVKAEVTCKHPSFEEEDVYRLGTYIFRQCRIVDGKPGLQEYCNSYDLCNDISNGWHDVSYTDCVVNSACSITDITIIIIRILQG